ncbi:MAG: transposase [Nitrosomonas sp.]|nr:transposase [Nitrosomonas sp.]
MSRQAIRGAKTSSHIRAFVLDDSIQVRHGKRCLAYPATLTTSGRHIMGQQVLTLGMSGTEGFVPIDSELFISATKAQELHQPFRDGRSIVAKRYRWRKPDQASNGWRHDPPGATRRIEADYLLADAWFGTKPIIRLADEQLLTSILRMKKNTMKYRLTECKGGQAIHRDRDVNTLYQSCIRCQWQKIPSSRIRRRHWMLS